MATVQEVRGTLKRIQKNLECPICLELLDDPYSTPCGHPFCRACICTVLASTKAPKCPLCKKPISKRSLAENTRLADLVEAVKELERVVCSDSGVTSTPPRPIPHSHEAGGTPGVLVHSLLHPTPRKPSSTTQTRASCTEKTVGSAEQQRRAESLESAEPSTSGLQHHGSGGYPVINRRRVKFTAKRRTPRAAKSGVGGASLKDVEAVERSQSALLEAIEAMDFSEPPWVGQPSTKDALRSPLRKRRRGVERVRAKKPRLLLTRSSSSTCKQEAVAPGGTCPNPGSPDGTAAPVFSPGAQTEASMTSVVLETPLVCAGPSEAPPPPAPLAGPTGSSTQNETLSPADMLPQADGLESKLSPPSPHDLTLEGLDPVHSARVPCTGEKGPTSKGPRPPSLSQLDHAMEEDSRPSSPVASLNVLGPPAKPTTACPSLSPLSPPLLASLHSLDDLVSPIIPLQNLPPPPPRSAGHTGYGLVAADKEEQTTRGPHHPVPPSQPSPAPSSCALPSLRRCGRLASPTHSSQSACSPLAIPDSFQASRAAGQDQLTQIRPAPDTDVGVASGAASSLPGSGSSLVEGGSLDLSQLHLSQLRRLMAAKEREIEELEALLVTGTRPAMPPADVAGTVTPPVEVGVAGTVTPQAEGCVVGTVTPPAEVGVAGTVKMPTEGEVTGTYVESGSDDTQVCGDMWEGAWPVEAAVVSEPPVVEASCTSVASSPAAVSVPRCGSPASLREVTVVAETQTECDRQHADTAAGRDATEAGSHGRAGSGHEVEGSLDGTVSCTPAPVEPGPAPSTNPPSPSLPPLTPPPHTPSPAERPPPPRLPPLTPPTRPPSPPPPSHTPPVRPPSSPPPPHTPPTRLRSRSRSVQEGGGVRSHSGGVARGRRKSCKKPPPITIIGVTTSSALRQRAARLIKALRSPPLLPTEPAMELDPDLLRASELTTCSKRGRGPRRTPPLSSKPSPRSGGGWRRKGTLVMLGSQDIGESSPDSLSPSHPPPPMLPSDHPFLSVSTATHATPTPDSRPTAITASPAHRQPPTTCGTSNEVQGPPHSIVAGQTDKVPVGHAPKLSDPVKALSCVGSGLSRLQLKQTQVLAKAHEGRLAGAFSRSTTHVVVAADENGNCLRTLKYLLGLASGRWIVGFSWINDSLKAGVLLPEADYEVKGTSAVASLAPRRARERRELVRPGLFHQYNFVLSGEFSSPSQDDMSQLIRLSGGLLVASMKAFLPTVGTHTVEVCGAGPGQPGPSPNPDPGPGQPGPGACPAVGCGWVLDSLTQYRVLPMEEYLLTS